MRHWSLMLGAVAMVAAVMAAASIAGADVVVKPGDMNGWTVAIQSAGSNSPVWDFTVAGAGTPPAGNGSFHFFTEVLTGSDPLEKIYLGTNNHSGVALNEITSFTYWTYLHSARYNPEAGWPDGQPPIVEIITDSGTTTQQRRFVFKPWGFMGERHIEFDTWQEWDMKLTEEGHTHWQMLGTNATTNVFGDWNWVKNRYGSVELPMRFATPLVGDYTNGYDPDHKYANQTGTSISIRVGSGKTNEWMIDENNPVIPFPSKPWWKESCGIDAYADKLVIGINGVETVYDFETPFTLEVGIRPSACRDKIIGSAKNNCIFVAFGRVMDLPTSTEFFLDDGGGKKLPVLTPDGNSVKAGEFWRAKGTLVWNKDTSRYDLYSSVYDIDPLYIPPPP